MKEINIKIFIICFLFIFNLHNRVFSDAIFTTIEYSYVEVDFTKFKGHSITVDNSYTDWKGIAPEQDNTYVYSSNEYIYKDAWYDDTGDGDYTYPTNKRFKEGMADIIEFRVTYDSTNLYFLIKLRDASPDGDGWWVNGILIGINDESSENGNYYFIQGDGIDPDKGPAAEINTKIKINYTIFASSTYRIRMWNHNGIKVGDGDDPDNSDGKLNNLKVKAKEWNKYEIGIPLTLIGSVSNKKLRFIVGSCFEENQMAREVQGYPLVTEWYITGGDRIWWNNTSPDPDVMDLIGASKILQEKDLNNYRGIFFNAEYDFEVFNMDIKPYIFSPKKDEKLTVYFTLATKAKVTINIRDLSGNLLKNLVKDNEISPEPNSNLYVEKIWDGRDKNNNLLKRGAYIVEAIFSNSKEEKIVRKVVRIW